MCNRFPSAFIKSFNKESTLKFDHSFRPLPLQKAEIYLREEIAYKLIEGA